MLAPGTSGPAEAAEACVADAAAEAAQGASRMQDQGAAAEAAQGAPSISVLVSSPGPVFPGSEARSKHMCFKEVALRKLL